MKKDYSAVPVVIEPPVEEAAGAAYFKEWLKNASYESLLRRWRFAPLDDPAFVGETGELFSERLNEERSKLTHDERVAVSKKVGWKEG